MKDQIILILSYLHGIWRYRWSALIIAWLVAIPGWVVVYSMPDQYTSSAVMLVDTKSVMQPLLKGLAVEADVDEGLQMMNRLLLSRKNLEEVIRQTDMDLRADTPEAMEALVLKLAGAISLKGTDKDKKKKRDTIYELSYTGESPELVYAIVSKLLNTLIETTLSSARTDTAAAQVFLDQQIAEYEARLSEAEQKLAAFKRANVGYMPDKTGGYYSRLQRKQGELDNLNSKMRLEKRRLVEMGKQLKGEKPMLDGSSSQANKLRQYQTQLQNLLTQFTEEHPDVKSLRAIIADILSQDSDEYVSMDVDTGIPLEFNPVYQDLKADIHRAKVDVETMKLTIAEKEDSLEQLKLSVDIIPEVEAKLAKLNRDYSITRDRYLKMVERRERARLAQEVGLSGSNIKFRIIESPRVATKPSGPERLLFLSAVFLAAIGAGLGWGFLRYLLHPTFIDSSQLRNNIGLPVLGSIGLHVTARHKLKRKMQLSSFLLTFSSLVVAFVIVLIFKDMGIEYFSALFASTGIML